LTLLRANPTIADARHGFLAGGTAGGSMTSPDTGAPPVTSTPASAAVTSASAAVTLAVAAHSAIAGRPELSAEPVLPEQSREDTDAAWGEYPGRGDERLYLDRPPHWDDF
jgi:hypothetical protein